MTKQQILEELNELIHDSPVRFPVEAMQGLKDALKYIEEQQTIGQPKWIPVSERLPKKADIPYDCLVTLEHGVVCEATFLDMDAPYHKWCANTGWLYHVTHWMPLPKPPKDGVRE